uniref:DNA-binding protein MNB1B n=1 Tax=Rhizophora mucronata TaxID=61149 RepID=A0A2P2MC74_RHIMU
MSFPYSAFFFAALASYGAFSAGDIDFHFPPPAFPTAATDDTFGFSFLKVCLNSSRKTKKALGGRFGLLGSFLALFSFLAFSLLLLSATATAFLFPILLKEKGIHFDSSL